ncbi:alpha/beta hydrolase [Georgenia halophila]|uniref:Alpha/beta hydrolase n=1 Tax=Georgenia halophila TaxID=620889 RepID=A0ABP8LJ13_9MICO
MSKTVNVVLVPGFWLGGWAWESVAIVLEQKGIRPYPVTPPGLRPGDRPAGVNLAQQITDVRIVVADLEGSVVLVGHSAGASVVNGVLDAEPDRFARVVYVDDAPLADGQTFPLDAPEGSTSLPLPSWDELARLGLSSEGLGADQRAEFRERARPEPAGVLRSAAHLENPRRKDVPVTVISCSMPAGELNDAIQAGDPFTAELADRDVTLADLPTGHWPMLSRAEDLANAIHMSTEQ